MLRLLPFLLMPVVLTACGASEKPFTDNSQDAELYAKDVKQIALDSVQRARRSREPADQLQTLVTELEGQEPNHRPIGQYKALYAELLANAKSLVEDCQKANGKPANLNAQLDALKQIAEKLPGEVQLDRK